MDNAARARQSGLVCLRNEEALQPEEDLHHEAVEWRHGQRHQALQERRQDPSAGQLHRARIHSQSTAPRRLQVRLAHLRTRHLVRSASCIHLQQRPCATRYRILSGAERSKHCTLPI